MKTCNERPLTSRPTVRPGSPWSFPQCLVETLPTGLTVVRVPMPGQRIVTMETVSYTHLTLPTTPYV